MLLTICHFSHLSGQGKIDSLEAVVQASSGAEKAKAMYALGVELFPSEEELEFLYLDSAADIYLDLDLQREWAATMARKVIFLERLEHNFRAVRTFERVDSSLYLIDTMEAYREALYSAGLTYGVLGKPEVGLRLLYKSLNEYAAHNDTASQISILGYFGMPYFFSQDAQYALDMQDSAIRLAEVYSGTDSATMALLYNNMGSLLLDAGLEAYAEEYLEKSLVYAEADNDPAMFLYIYFTLAEVGLTRNDLESARSNFRRSAELLDSLGSPSSLAVAMEALGHYHLLNGDRSQSDFWIQRSLGISDSAGNQDQKMDLLDMRYKIFRSLGDYEGALEALEEWSELNARSMTALQRAQIEELRVANEMERAERENDLLRVENETILAGQRRNFILFGSVILLIVVIGIILAYFLLRTRRLNRSISAQNDRLAEQNEQLQQLTEDNELLMGIVAHDLKAPLVKVESLMGLIVDEDELAPDKKVLLQMARRVIAGGQTLVADILLLSEAGRGASPELEQFLLGDLVEGVVRDFREIAERKRIELIVEPPADQIRAWVHPPYLIRVLDNLVSNSIKFSQPGQPVYIRWGRDEEGAWCEVADEGPGIPEAERPRLFERFSRLSNRPTAGESSTGLGMFIVKTLLDAMEGSISLQTEVGKGTIFRIRFKGNE